MIDFQTRNGKKAKGLTEAEANAYLDGRARVGDAVPLSELYRRPNPVVRASRAVRSFVADLAFGIHLIITGRD